MNYPVQHLYEALRLENICPIEAIRAHHTLTRLKHSELLLTTQLVNVIIRYPEAVNKVMNALAREFDSGNKTADTSTPQ